MYRHIFKTGAKTFSGIGALLIINNIPKSFCEKQKLLFDTKGLDYELNSFTTNEKMLLTGVGMRKLNLFITEFNVYLAGIHLNKNTLEKVKKWKQTESDIPLSSVILSDIKQESYTTFWLKPLIKNECPVIIKLKFVRDLSYEKLMNAFNEAFIGLPEDEIELFKRHFINIIGKSGVEENDEIHFSWINNDSLILSKNEKSSEILLLPNIVPRLLDVYLHPDKTVSKDLFDSFHNNILQLISDELNEKSENEQPEKQQGATEQDEKEPEQQEQEQQEQQQQEEQEQQEEQQKEQQPEQEQQEEQQKEQQPEQEQQEQQEEEIKSKYDEK